MKRESGFTLIELLATMALLSILMTLGVGALRYFWLGQSLVRGQDEIFTQLRGLQQQVVAESNPLVFGAWFKVTTPSSDDGGSHWGTFRYNPGNPTGTPAVPATCRSTGQFRLDGSVDIASVEFANSLSGDENLVTSVRNVCGAQIAAASAATDFVLFLARGTATAGCVELNQPARDMENIGVSVSTLTGRVERVDEDQMAARCA